jgi:hypothetical protein
MNTNNIGVALIFFNRPLPLRTVFDELKKSKPKILFLIQDGARENNLLDIENISKCRKIVEEVDWEFEVYKNYSEMNLSCDNRIFTGLTWAFTFVDKLVVLEDDCVPSLSFLPFCEELLILYENDKRIHMISGTNYIDNFRDVS